MADHHRLPPLKCLLSFEAAARLSNFTAAARELGSTQPGVSQRIGELEADLGVPLFDRQHRGVALTADGRRLFEAVRHGLAELGSVAAHIRERRTRQVLAVATDFGFATYWLMPRLPRLGELMPELDVRIVTAQQAVDPVREPVDAVIAFGTGHWPGCRADLLFPEEVLPVCSPALRKRLRGPAAIAAGPLLHLEGPGQGRWLDWAGWFARRRLQPRAGAKRLSFTNYPLLLQSAIAGQGLALGWLPLVNGLLGSGQLVAACEEVVRTDSGCYLVQSEAARRRPAARRFRDWIVAECAA